MPRTTGIARKRIKTAQTVPSTNRASRLKRAPGKQCFTSGAKTKVPGDELLVGTKTASLLASSVDDISPELKLAIYKQSVQYGQELAHQEHQEAVDWVDRQLQDLQGWSPQHTEATDAPQEEEDALVLSFNNATLDFDSIETFAINEDAFGVTNGNNQPRTKVAERQAKSRATLKIVKAILAVGNIEKQALALRQALCHPQIRVVAKAAGFHDNMAAHYQNEQAKKMIQRALETSSTKGHCNNDKASFIDSVIMSISESPDNRVEKKKRISQAQMAKSLGLNASRAKRLFLTGKKKRKALTENPGRGSWSQKPKRKGYCKISRDVKFKLRNWIVNYSLENRCGCLVLEFWLVACSAKQKDR